MAQATYKESKHIKIRIGRHVNHCRGILSILKIIKKPTEITVSIRSNLFVNPVSLVEISETAVQGGLCKYQDKAVGAPDVVKEVVGERSGLKGWNIEKYAQVTHLQVDLGNNNNTYIGGKMRMRCYFFDDFFGILKQILAEKLEKDFCWVRLTIAELGQDFSQIRHIHTEPSYSNERCRISAILRHRGKLF